MKEKQLALEATIANVAASGTLLMMGMPGPPPPAARRSLGQLPLMPSALMSATFTVGVPSSSGSPRNTPPRVCGLRKKKPPSTLRWA